jgi:transcriptional regulator GlxA family with amidase domain
MHSRLDSIQDGQWEALAKEAEYKSESLAALCRVSLRQLQRFFKCRFGKTPSTWLLELRLRHAQVMLQQGYYTQEIAKDLNFADAPHLCHAFKKVHGTPPQSFPPQDGSHVV